MLFHGYGQILLYRRTRSSRHLSLFWGYLWNRGSTSGGWHWIVSLYGFQTCSGKKNMEKYTLQGTNISHLGKRKIIFKMPFLGDMLVPWRVSQCFHMDPGLPKMEIAFSHCQPFSQALMVALKLTKLGSPRPTAVGGSHQERNSNMFLCQYVYIIYI